MTDMQCDIAVIGAGPAGLSFARAMAGSGLDILLVERSPEASLAEPAFDGREIALTHRSQAILAAFGIWDAIGYDDPGRTRRISSAAEIAQSRAGRCAAVLRRAVLRHHHRKGVTRR
ncbi:FAD-dependent monooxygenase [Leptolyngbya sp. 15MV]|nr:FAD-dependent monooxygenase [Leptolyngbya sp. 15MV]